MKSLALILLLGLGFFQQQTCQIALCKMQSIKQADTTVALGGRPAKLIFPNIKHA